MKKDVVFNFNDHGYSMRKLLVLSFFCFFSSLVFSQNANVKIVNRKAAVNCLTKASEELANKNWTNALFYADLGLAYDNSIADFYYIIAKSYNKLGRSIKEQIVFAESATKENMKWRYYDKKDAKVFCASLYAKTARYQEALKLLSDFNEQTADLDYIRVLSYYGLKQKTDARKLLSQALDKWAFDFRFARIFLQYEKYSAKTAINKAISKKIIARSYVWENSNPEILVLLSPFETDLNETIRRIKVFREMYAPFSESCTTEDLYLRSYAVLLSLNFGIISEEMAINEFFNMNAIFFNPLSRKKEKAKGFFAKHLEELCRLVENPTMRSIIAGKIVSYEDCIFDDYDDTALNSIIFYESGRPSLAIFDSNQDGVADMTVKCNFGIPQKINMPEKNICIEYDEYPNVKRLKFEENTYIMRPLDLQFTPVRLSPLNLNLFAITSPYSNIYVLKENNSTNQLSKKALMRAAVYMESKTDEGYTERILLSDGLALSSQTLLGNKPIANANYEKGIISNRSLDRDCDGYFETYESYDKTGKLFTVSIDINRNKIYEYVEKHNENNIQKIWDDNEDGNWDVLFTKIGEHSLVKWLHPINKEVIEVDFVDSIPKSIRYLGVKKELQADSENKFFWVGRKTNDAKLNSLIEKTLTDHFEKMMPELLSYSVTINGVNIFAVKSGGLIFAQIVESTE